MGEGGKLAWSPRQLGKLAWSPQQSSGGNLQACNDEFRFEGSGQRLDLAARSVSLGSESMVNSFAEASASASKYQSRDDDGIRREGKNVFSKRQKCHSPNSRSAENGKEKGQIDCADDEHMSENNKEDEESGAAIIAEPRGSTFAAALFENEEDEAEEEKEDPFSAFKSSIEEACSSFVDELGSCFRDLQYDCAKLSRAQAGHLEHLKKCVDERAAATDRIQKRIEALRG